MAVHLRINILFYPILLLKLTDQIIRSKLKSKQHKKSDLSDRAYNPDNKAVGGSENEGLAEHSDACGTECHFLFFLLLLEK